MRWFKFFVLSFLLCILSSLILSQGRSNYWPLGYSSFGNPFNGGLTVEYPNNTFLFYDFPRVMNFDYTNSSICNDTGALQFYSNGVYIANASDDTMLNGSGINPSYYTTQMSNIGLSLPQAEIIIPAPNDDSLYYLFHLTEDLNGPLYSPLYLQQSIINMHGDSGRGVVIIKNKTIINDTLFPGGITMCKHANGRDWWLLLPEYGNSIGFYILLITPDTIQEYSHVYFPIDGTQGGQATFSPDGSKYILSYWSGIAFFDFDRCGGVLNLNSNTYTPNSIYYLGVSVAPNSKFAYCGFNGIYIFQYDLQSSNIANTIDTIATFDGFQSFGFSAFFWLHQLAPDGKIYIATGNSTFAYHVINKPDSTGLLCDVQQHAVLFPHLNNSIPNFPNYDLGPLAGSPCDTLGLNLTPALSKGEGVVRLAPNPANNSFYIKYDIPTNENLLFVLYDSYGKEVLRKILYGTFKNLLVHTESLNNGIYFWRVVQNYNPQTQRSNGKSPSGDLGVLGASGKIVILH